jgi:hypothetical protein
MTTVKVYKWQKFDINSNEYKAGPNMATRQAIKSFGGAVPIEETEIEVDEISVRWQRHDAARLGTEMTRYCLRAGSNRTRFRTGLARCEW